MHGLILLSPNNLKKGTTLNFSYLIDVQELLEKALAGILRQKKDFQNSPQEQRHLTQQLNSVEKELSRVTQELAEASKVGVEDRHHSFFINVLAHIHQLLRILRKRIADRLEYYHLRLGKSLIFMVHHTSSWSGRGKGRWPLKNDWGGRPSQKRVINIHCNLESNLLPGFRGNNCWEQQNWTWSGFAADQSAWWTQAQQECSFPGMFIGCKSSYFQYLKNICFLT